VPVLERHQGQHRRQADRQRGRGLNPPLGTPSAGATRRALWLLAIGTIAFGLAALPSLNTMSDHGTGVIDLELMATTKEAERVLSEYGPDGRSAARTSLWLDYPYLVCYSLFLALAGGTIAGRAERLGRGTWRAVGITVAWGGLLAGLLDAIENAALLWVLDGHPEQPFPAIAYVCALPKFALAAAAVLYLLIGLLVLRRAPPAEP
jgi:hypothetical protein